MGQTKAADIIDFFLGPGAFILEVGLWDLFATLAFPALKGLEALGDCKRGWGPENSGSGPFVSTWPLLALSD